jgi:hypothetical protein
VVGCRVRGPDDDCEAARPPGLGAGEAQGDLAWEVLLQVRT